MTIFVTFHGTVFPLLWQNRARSQELRKETPPLAQECSFPEFDMQSERNFSSMRQSALGVKRRLAFPIQKAPVVLFGGVTKWLDWSKTRETLVTPLPGELS